MTKYSYGQRLLLLRGSGKPKAAYIVSKDEDHLVKLSEVFPYVPGSKHFFVHIEKLRTNWRLESEGIQAEMKF